MNRSSASSSSAQPVPKAAAKAKAHGKAQSQKKQKNPKKSTGMTDERCAQCASMVEQMNNDIWAHAMMPPTDEGEEPPPAEAHEHDIQDPELRSMVTTVVLGGPGGTRVVEGSGRSFTLPDDDDDDGDGPVFMTFGEDMDLRFGGGPESDDEDGFVIQFQPSVSRADHTRGQ